MSLVRKETVYSWASDSRFMLRSTDNDYVCTVTPFPQIAVDVQSCQIGNFCTDFRIREPKVSQLHPARLAPRRRLCLLRSHASGQTADCGAEAERPGAHNKHNSNPP